MNRRERRAAGKIEAPRQATGPAALYEAGIAHLRAGRMLDAQVCGQQALTADPEHADLLHLMSLLTIDAQHFDLAAEWARRAVAQDPKPQYLFTLGSVLRQQKQFEDALAAFEHAARLRPEAVELWRAVANVMVDLDRAERAALAFARVVKLNPRDRDAAYNAGSLLQRSGRAAEALPYLQMSDDLQADHAPTLQMRALALHDLERDDEALADIERAHRLEPASAEICNNAGAILHRLGRDEEALTWFDRALQRRPAYIGALCNKGAALTYLHRFDDAVATYRRARAIDPSHAEAEWALALLNLLRGNFEAGWAGREVRWRVPDLPIAHFELHAAHVAGMAAARGQDRAGPCRRGIGRYHSVRALRALLAARGARVLLVVPASLCRPAVETSGRGAMSAVSAASCPPSTCIVRSAACRSRSDPGSTRFPPSALSARAGGGARAGLGGPSRPARQLAGRPRLVRQSQPQE